VERAFERDTTLRERTWPGSGKRMLLMPEELADISNPWLRNDSMDTVSMFGNSSVFIHPLCAAVEKIGKFISKNSRQ
jgi:hypothetical protein